MFGTNHNYLKVLKIKDSNGFQYEAILSGKLSKVEKSVTVYLSYASSNLRSHCSFS